MLNPLPITNEWRNGEYRGWKLKFAWFPNQNSWSYDIRGEAWCQLRPELGLLYYKSISEVSLNTGTREQAQMILDKTLEMLTNQLTRKIDLWEDNPRVQMMYKLGGLETLNEILRLPDGA